MPESAELDLPPANFRWGVTTIPTFNLGLNTRDLAENLDAQQAVTHNNFFITQDGLRVDTGRKQIGSVVRGVPRGAVEHETISGIRTLMLVTDATVYSYNSAQEQWQYISDGVDTELSSAASATDTSIEVDDITGFGDGDFIGILLDDGSQHQTTINGAPAGSTINLTDAMPGAAAVNNAVVKAKDLTGNDSREVVFEAVPWHEWTVFTNGIDPPQRYDGTTVEDIPNLPSGGNTVCKSLVAFKSYLVLLGLQEGGTEFPYNVRWSDNGDATNWSTGDAGFTPLTDTRDPIVGGKLLGNFLVIHGTRSMTRCQFLTQGPSPFQFTGISFGKSAQAEGVSALSHNSIFALEDAQVFPSRKGIYIYRGGVTVDRISNLIPSLIIDTMDASKEHKAFTQVSDRRDWLMFFLPRTTEDWSSTAIILDRLRSAWMTRRFSFQNSFAAIRTGKSGVRYVDLVGTMAEQTWTALTLSAGEPRPTIVMGDPNNNVVYEYDYESPHENPLNIAVGRVVSKVFRSYERKIRLLWVEITATAGNVALTIKEGTRTVSSSFRSISTSDYKTVRFTVDAELEQFQLSIACSPDIGQGLRQVSFKTRPASRWNI